MNQGPVTLGRREAPKRRSTIAKFLITHRLGVSRLALIVLVPMILFTRHSFSDDSVTCYVMQVLGPALIIVGGLGRIWAILYISGRKSKKLTSAGPYSMMQHPLYSFSSILCLGVATAFENLLLLVFMVPLFVLYYFAVISREERRLSKKFGAEYDRYRMVTPRFLPAIWKYRRGAWKDGVMAIEERAVLRTIRESTLFLLLIPLAIVVNLLHDTGVLPAVALF